MSDQYPTIEQEIVAKAHFVPEKKYRKRQDYLAAIFVATTKMPEDEWNALSDSAYEWTKQVAAVYKFNKDKPPSEHQLIPDFSGETDEGDHDGEESLDGDHESIPNGSTVLEGSEASHEDAGSVGDTDQAKAKTPKTKKAAKVKAAKPPKKDKTPSRGMNEWGVVKGTKSDQACQMAARPEGTTQKEISEALGQTHYNLFNRLQRRGVPVKVDGTRIWLLPK